MEERRERLAVAGLRPRHQARQILGRCGGRRGIAERGAHDLLGPLEV
jgi:hypothetical protein